jgi:hypothetical protein
VPKGNLGDVRRAHAVTLTSIQGTSWGRIKSKIKVNFKPFQIKEKAINKRESSFAHRIAIHFLFLLSLLLIVQLLMQLFSNRKKTKKKKTNKRTCFVNRHLGCQQKNSAPIDRLWLVCNQLEFSLFVKSVKIVKLII